MEEIDDPLHQRLGLELGRAVVRTGNDDEVRGYAVPAEGLDETP
jgi:hypothetical protein